MPDVIFRTSPPEVKADTVNIPEPYESPKDSISHHYDEEPVDSTRVGETVLSAIGIQDDIKSMPTEDQTNLSEVGQYITNIIKSRGLEPVSSSYKQVLNDLRLEMGLESNAEPSIILDRIGGVVKAWRDLSFIPDPKEKKAFFMKLARQPDSKSMNRLVLEKMTDYKIWR
jgi:hypothetical protein